MENCVNSLFIIFSLPRRVLGSDIKAPPRYGSFFSPKLKLFISVLQCAAIMRLKSTSERSPQTYRQLNLTIRVQTPVKCIVHL